VLPTFEARGTRIDAVLSDNGREFCGREDRTANCTERVIG